MKCALISILLFPHSSFSQKQNLQIKFGDEVSVFSDKAYRKRAGQLFEAVGNVVILHKDETLYGQSASFDLDSGVFEIKGNVRYVSQGVTLYGSEMKYNMKTDYLIMKNSRIVSETFNIVALKIERLSKDHYKAEDAEFTTCRNCPESWAIYGEEIDLTVGGYVTIVNGLIKVNGTGIMIVPYIVLPVKRGRETGLLFPKLTSRFSEGVVFEQPWFWAIDDSRDLTLTPTFWATRGYGADVQYRHIFGEKKWVEFNTRLINDEIYLPGKLDTSESGEDRFRHVSEVESHMQWTQNFSQHFRFTEVRDLDAIQDFSVYSDPLVRGSEVGLTTYTEYRHDYATATLSAEFNRNQLINVADAFDHDYVQIMPQIEVSTIPFEIFKSKRRFFNNVSFGANSTFTNFRQNIPSEDTTSRNAQRTTVTPYIDWNYFQLGGFEMSSRFKHEFMYYDFRGENDGHFAKRANILRTEFSFGLEKIFGLSYEEEVPIENVSDEQIKKIRQKKTEQAKKKKTTLETIGILPDFERSLKDDFVVAKRNSYKHNQDYKLIHHYIFDEGENGDSNHGLNISSSNTNWFDYDDAIRSEENRLGSNDTKITIPRKNTLELQWNNSLIKKTPKKFSYKVDQQYLKDHFSYSRVGYFNISQGMRLEDGLESSRNKLTRLYVASGVSVFNWELSFDEYYFHDTNNNIFSSSLVKKWDKLELLTRYNRNSFEASDLETLSFGAQIKPLDLFRFSFIQEFDISADENTRSIFEVDYIPSNNCYVFNLNYRETLVDERVSFNIAFNFGGESFKRAQQGTNLKEKY